MDRLEGIQDRFILRVPVSTPKVSLRAEAGLLSMKHRIWEEKIRLVMALKRLREDSLANQIYREQRVQGWRPWTVC